MFQFQYIAGFSLSVKNEEQANGVLVRTTRSLLPKKSGLVKRLFEKIAAPFNITIKILKRLVEKLLHLCFPHENNENEIEKLEELEQKFDDLSKKLFSNDGNANGEPISELAKRIKQLLDELVSDIHDSHNPNQDRLNDLKEEIEELLDDIAEGNTDQQNSGKQQKPNPTQNIPQNGQHSQKSETNDSAPPCQPIVILLQQPKEPASQHEVVPCNQLQQQPAAAQLVRPIPPPLSNQPNSPC